MELLERLQFWARETPDAAAVAIGVTVVHTYQSLAHRVASLAAGLSAAGLSSGDRVALLMENRPEFFECLLACWQSSLTAVPINAKLHPSEVDWIMGHSQCRLMIVSPALAHAGYDLRDSQVLVVGSADYQRVASHSGKQTPPAAHSPAANSPAANSLADNTLAWIFYTSGTTGRPKGAMISHQNLSHMIEAYFASIDVRGPYPSILHPAPLSHGSGLYALAHLWVGSTQVVPESSVSSSSFDDSELFTLSELWPNSVFFAAPTMLKRLIDSPDASDFRDLKCAIAGGAPLYLNDLHDWYERFGARLCQLYGQGESPMTISGWSQDVFSDRDNPAWESCVASVGTAQHGVELAIVDESGNRLPPADGAGQIGEVICRSRSVVAGYWNDKPATNTAIRDGWLWTGDMGRINQAGYLTLSDRSKDVIISGGSNIYPREIEEVLVSHPLVEEVSVIGMPDQHWGETVLAFVVIGSDPSSENPDHRSTAHRSTTESVQRTLDAHCLASIARFKRPREYRFVERLPKNNYGKVLKTKLRQLACESQAEG